MKIQNMALVLQQCVRNPRASYRAVMESITGAPAIAAPVVAPVAPVPDPSGESSAAANFMAAAADFAARFPAGIIPSVGQPETYPDPVADGTPNPLWNYFQTHRTGPGIHKWTHYFPMYHRHLAKFIGKQVHIVEVGIYSGGSLGMWRDYFGPGCHVSGIDVEEACRAYASDDITVTIGDQQDRSFWQKFREQAPPVDILIDDGGHTPEQQQVTLEEMLPHIQPGGVFLCEDIHGSENFFTAYAHRLAGQLNFPDLSGLHMRKGDLVAATVPLQQSVASAHFYPFAVVFERTLHPFSQFEAPAHGTEWQPFLGPRS